MLLRHAGEEARTTAPQRLATIASGVVVSILLLFSAASAETVHFRSATTPPTPLQQRLAKEHGQPIAEHPSEEIAGEFYRPSGKGPFPAIVSLHGCAGRGSRESEDASGGEYVAAGYALLIVDSFGPRSVKERCGGAYGASVDRVMDAYGALKYLAGLPFIDPDQIAVIGYSQGADIALSTVALGRDETLFDRHFRAAVAYYPWCDVSAGAVIAPTLILIGALDDWTPARNCQEMMARRTGEGAPMRLMIYPGAHHAFNSTRLRGKPETYFGHHLEYNETADHAAAVETLATLRQAFGR